MVNIPYHARKTLVQFGPPNGALHRAPITEKLKTNCCNFKLNLVLPHQRFNHIGGNDGTCHEILGINGSEWFLVKRCWGAFKNPAKDSSCKENKTYTLCYMLPTTFYQKHLLIQGSLWKGTMLIKSKVLGFYLIQQACFTI